MSERRISTRLPVHISLKIESLYRQDHEILDNINESIVDEYTKAQFSGSRRGAGFDRPTAAGGGTCHELASQHSFGHSGFTGTLAWADPTYEINYVFLSNRVYPSQENWKIRDMNIRTEIQGVIYEAVKAAK